MSKQRRKQSEVSVCQNEHQTKAAVLPVFRGFFALPRLRTVVEKCFTWILSGINCYHQIWQVQYSRGRYSGLSHCYGLYTYLGVLATVTDEMDDKE